MAVTHDPPPKPAQPALCTLRVSPPAPIVGQVVQVTATFTVGDKPHDPASVSARTRAPGQDRAVEAAVVKLADGVYLLTVVAQGAGLWALRVEGADGEGVAERELFVRPSAL